MSRTQFAWEKCYTAGASVKEKAESIGVLRLFTDMLENLEEIFGQKPELYQEEARRIIWLVYPDIAWDNDRFLEEFGVETAAVSQECPVTVFGMSSQMDMGELEIVWDENSDIVCRKRNSRGNDFFNMEGMGLKIQCPSQEAYEAYLELCGNIHGDYPYAALSRKNMKYFSGCRELTEIKTDTYYCYIPVNEESDRFFLDVLSLEQKKELWLKFLRDGVSPMEFAYVTQAIVEEEEINVFEWELSLHMAMAAEGMRIEYGEEDFQIVDKKGRRRWFSFQSVLEAEKLFMKILFPVVPVKGKGKTQK